LGGGGGGVASGAAGLPGRQSARDRKMNILHEKIDFLCKIKFKLLSQIKGNLINYCDFFKLNFSVWGKHCD
jgi:hypothetical protein